MLLTIQLYKSKKELKNRQTPPELKLNQLFAVLSPNKDQ